MKTTQYKTLQFFDCFACGKKLDIFYAGEWIVITRKRFNMLASCTFVTLGVEWKLDATTKTVERVNG